MTTKRRPCRVVATFIVDAADDGAERELQPEIGELILRDVAGARNVTVEVDELDADDPYNNPGGDDPIDGYTFVRVIAPIRGPVKRR